MKIHEFLEANGPSAWTKGKIAVNSYGGYSVSIWNDACDTSFEDILKMFKDLDL